MMTFNETQKFRNTWFWFAVAAGAVFLIINMLLFKQTMGNTSPAIHFLMLVSVLGSCVIFWFMKLNTHIDSTGISVKFFVIFQSKNEWKWGEIQRAYVREYKPLLEYGGWGVRYSWRNGRAYNVKGKTGLQLELKNGKKILIGTQQKDELNRILSYLREQYRIDAIEIMG